MKAMARSPSADAVYAMWHAAAVLGEAVWGCLTIDEFFEGLQEMKGHICWDSFYLDFLVTILEEPCISKSHTETWFQLHLDFT